MKVEFDWQDDVHYGVIVFTVPEHKTDHCAEALVQQLNAREEALAEMKAERDRLRAYAECEEAWHSNYDWSRLFGKYGWDGTSHGNSNWAENFLAQLRATALSAKGEGE